MLSENANTILATVSTVILAVFMFLYGILIAHQVLVGTVTALLVIRLIRPGPSEREIVLSEGPNEAIYFRPETRKKSGFRVATAVLMGDWFGRLCL